MKQRKITIWWFLLAVGLLCAVLIKSRGADRDAWAKPRNYRIVNTNDYPPIPVAPKRFKKSNPRASAGMLMRPLVVIAPKQYALIWDYPGGNWSGTFDLWHSTNLSNGFTPWLVTNRGPVKLQTALPQEFFIIRYRDEFGNYSDWARN